ncbi:DUF624 domain-containing protein [Alicyclobacillus fastidiosus]|uniref:DUF624 domain-containing protein n=1 Tax=Alicyclobacillus fastidiosus TaxID=392011 RepID=A0ABY6ZMS6_9BACL|nr:DUF624 domain-containing protein [Alicyclobacillus fastidiosus]WAH44142.1 DUF624 domain-containing protein [Alicyclobacillus fastidiosus]GMA60445.1 hypothetical protein GCM10025859_08850 [Alicyclobacillus fastidiosus]
MTSSAFFQHLNGLFTWVYRLAYVTILWWMFVIVGVGVVGIFPASAAMFCVMRKWILLDPDIALFKEFCSAYKRDFLTSNIAGYSMTVIGAVLALNMHFLVMHHNAVTSIAIGWLTIVSGIYVIMFSLMFPILAHFNLGPLAGIRYSFVLCITSPLRSLSLLGAIMILIIATVTIGGLVSIFFVSIIAFVVILITYYKNPNFGKIYELRS